MIEGGSTASEITPLEQPDLAAQVALLAAAVARLSAQPRPAAPLTLEERLAAAQQQLAAAHLQLAEARAVTNALPPTPPPKVYLDIHQHKALLKSSYTHLPTASAVPAAPHLFSLYGEQFYQAFRESKRSAAAEEYQWFACAGVYLAAILASLQQTVGAVLEAGSEEEELVLPTLNSLEELEQRLQDRLALLRLRSGQVADADSLFIDLFDRATRETVPATASAGIGGSKLAGSLWGKHRQGQQTAGFSQAAKLAAQGLRPPSTPTPPGEDRNRREAEAAKRQERADARRKAGERREREERAAAAAAAREKSTSRPGAGRGKGAGRAPKDTGEDSA